METARSNNHTTEPTPGALVNEDTISQCQALKKHLESGKTFTGLQALEICGCLNYKGRVHDLRNRYKLDVVTTMMPVGKRKRVAVYSLKKEE